MSQLQRDTTCRQPRGRTRAPGAAAAPGVMGPAGRRAAARGLSCPSTEEAGKQPPVPVKQRRCGEGYRARPRYSQEVAAHGGGDQHRDDHPAETPPLAREGPAPKRPTPRHPRSPPSPHSPAVRPFGHEPGGSDAHEAPEGGEEDERQREAVRRHGRSAPDSAPPTATPAHCRATPPIRARSAPRSRHRHLPLAETFGSARIGSARIGSARPGTPPPGPRIPPHLAPQRSTQPDTSASQNSFMLQSWHSHPPPPPPAQPGWAHIPLRTRGSAAPASGGAAPREGSPAGALLGNSPELVHEPQCHAEQRQGARLVCSSQRCRDIKQQGAYAQAHLPRREEKVTAVVDAPLIPCPAQRVVLESHPKFRVCMQYGELWGLGSFTSQLRTLGASIDPRGVSSALQMCYKGVGKKIRAVPARKLRPVRKSQPSWSFEGVGSSSRRGTVL